jgi:hypothetical protein
MGKELATKEAAIFHRAVRFHLTAIGVFCILMVVGFAITTRAQPANNNFANRLLIEGNNGTVSGTLSNATSEAGEPLLAGISSGQTAWWSWIAPSNGILTLTPSASSFSPLLTVFTGDQLTKLSLFASNNYLICYSDGECGCHWRMRDAVTFHVFRGRSYQISVDSAIFTDASIQLQVTPVGGGVEMLSWGPTFTTNFFAGGNLQLGLQFTPAPKNDDFDHPINIEGTSARIATSNNGATKEAGEPDHEGNPGGSSVWYSWTAPATGRVTLSTNEIPLYAPPSWGDIGVIITSVNWPPNCGDAVDQNPPPQFYPLFGVYTGAKVSSLVSADCLPMGLDAYPNAIEFDAVKGQTYKIAFDGNLGTTADIRLFLSLTKPAWNDYFGIRVRLNGANIAATGYNAGATHAPGEPVLPGSSGKNSWWAWTAPVSGVVSIDLAGSDYSFPVGVFTGTTMSHLNLIAANSGAVSFEAVQGHIYQIAVGDMAGLTGAIKFSLHVLAQGHSQSVSR